MPVKSRQPFVVTETGPLEGPGIFETYFSEPVKRAVEAAGPKIKAGAKALIPDTVENWFTDILTSGRLAEETNRLERSGLTPAQIEAYRADLAAGRAVAIPSAAPAQALTVGSEFTESSNPIAQLMGGADPSGPGLAAGELIGDPERFGSIAKKAKALLESWKSAGLENLTLADAVDYLKRKPQGDPNLTKAMEFIPLSPIDEQAQAISAAPERRLKNVQEILQNFKQEGMDFGAAHRELRRLGYDPAEYEDLIGATLGERRNQLTRPTDEDYLEMAKRKKVSPYKAEAGVDPANPLGLETKTEADLKLEAAKRGVEFRRHPEQFKTKEEYLAAVRKSFEESGHSPDTVNQLMFIVEQPKAKYVSSMKGKDREIRYYELPYDVGGSKKGTRVTEDFLDKHDVPHDFFPSKTLEEAKSRVANLPRSKSKVSAEEEQRYKSALLDFFDTEFSEDLGGFSFEAAWKMGKRESIDALHDLDYVNEVRDVLKLDPLSPEEHLKMLKKFGFRSKS